MGINSVTAQREVQSKPTFFGKEISADKISPEGYIRCLTDEYEEFQRNQNARANSKEAFEAALELKIQEYKAQQAVSSQSGSIITIPVVVHVIHNGQPVGVAPNITDSQIESQITVLNQDFRRITGTPGFNNNPAGADTQIQFALAKVDPNGNPTNGIDRVNLCKTAWQIGNITNGEVNTIVKPATIWDPTQYLNMWVVNFVENDVLGFAQFPDGSGLPGLNTNGGLATTDGVVANYNFFGSIAFNDGSFLLSAPYNRGRTMTHEVGHWLGLRHIWGDGGCGVDDFCVDTPLSDAPNFGCAIGHVSCTSTDMVENYMDYSDDLCMNIFTQNQKDRMVVIMNNAARRASLKTSTKDVAIPLFAIDAEVKIENSCETGGCGTGTNKVVLLYNRGTSNLTAATLNYNFNGGTNQVVNWTGNLLSNKFATITLPNSTAQGLLTVTVATANNTTDQRVSNNTATKNFEGELIQNYASNLINFRLQLDNYGSDITWTLKNGLGNTLYFGGPYLDTDPNLGPLIQQQWNLPNNDCYTFQINDVFGDGICCAWGDGYYDIKTPEEIVIASGGDFGDGESKTFAINLLSNDSFDSLQGITLYPNPTKDVLNIKIDGMNGFPESLTIYNALGQVVENKTISTEANLSVNTSGYTTGVYFVKITKDNESKTLQFIKN
ncbi:M43 family zinc metalloprotease [Flavobacterium orientale]|uniref:Por secretion system C-terminal sorting domain-containing protein n=1 Tax=Flavobacterium orientale TaxID=1756020 RepID=A0A917DA41_9FLAO|nr:M43 family zinc metalloprotease [Flavobacterium orientale]GGD18593.1 hypothetical protein GCM10011343_06500 [Flavobacterium orientale]